MTTLTQQPGAERHSSSTDNSWTELTDELVAFVGRRVESREVAEDIVQDVFERMQRSDASSIENPQAWLYRSARNAIIDHYRTRRPTEQLPADLSAEPAEDETDGPAGPNEATRELARCLRPFIDRLPESYRRAVTLVDLEGRTHAAAAELEHVSISGMKSRVQRGRAQLGSLLRECCAVGTTSGGAVSSYVRRNPGRACGC